ncbi:MAG: T9SS type A sorting domain-containing protein, partial [Schleiferiaceae bacterium]
DVFIATHGRGWFQTTTTSVNRPLSTNQPEQSIERTALGIYPNPTTDVVRVPVTDGAVTLTVRTMDGRLVRRVDLKNTAGLKAVPVDVANLPKGQYVLTRSQGSEAVSEIFVKR